MNILVTNDDGINSRGLMVLVSELKEIARVTVVVPDSERSAIGTAVSLFQPLRVKEVAPIATGVTTYKIDGTPADCVVFSLFSKEFETPNLILSGINWGNNCCLGPMIGSGTIGACWMAALEGVPSIAFSLHRKGHDWKNRKNWGDEQKLVDSVLRIVDELKPELGPDKFFDVNLPEEPEGAEIVYTQKLQRKNYRTVVEKRHDPNNVPYFWITGIHTPPEEGTDLHELIVKNKIVITEFSYSSVIA